jgi:hypothetical protein
MTTGRYVTERSYKLRKGVVNAVHVAGVDQANVERGTQEYSRFFCSGSATSVARRLCEYDGAFTSRVRAPEEEDD